MSLCAMNFIRKEQNTRGIVLNRMRIGTMNIRGDELGICHVLFLYICNSIPILVLTAFDKKQNIRLYNT